MGAKAAVSTFLSIIAAAQGNDYNIALLQARAEVLSQDIIVSGEWDYKGNMLRASGPNVTNHPSHKFVKGFASCYAQCETDHGERCVGVEMNDDALPQSGGFNFGVCNTFADQINVYAVSGGPGHSWKVSERTASPTPSPTLSPTQSPTLSPTQSPTPAPADPTAFGDPHATNVRGEKFDIVQTGRHEMLRIPRRAQSVNLSLYATVVDLGDGECSRGMYISSVRFAGAWIGNKDVSVTHGHRLGVVRGGAELNASQLALSEAAALRIRHDRVVLDLGGASVVVRRGTVAPHFLNIRASSLSNLECTVGGLLGEDDHHDASARPASCAESKGVVLVGGEANSEKSSFASAEL